MEKRSRHIIKNVSFCVPQNKQSHMGLEYILFVWTIPITSHPDLI